ncbi:MAG: lipase family protein [Crocinitomicaceae bacterium]|nr:lipase family protein [Crocinitomicaceae bacterium]
MKLFLILSTILLVAHTSQAQLSSGMKAEEARDMIQLCNSYTYLELYGDDSDIIPNGYKRIYTSPTLGMDNKFQVYVKGGNIGVINFRGSTAKKISWMENMYSALIPIQGEISIQERTYQYKYGTDPTASVHSGFALSLAYMHDEIIDQIVQLNSQGVYNIMITGHSQGGALAIMLAASLKHSDEISAKNKFKVYTFAQPMSGNYEFAREYNRDFCARGMSYSFINPADFVPTLPMSYNDSTFLRDNLISMVTDREGMNKQELIMEGLKALLGDKLKPTASKFGASVENQIREEMGDITLPKPSGEINFSQVGNITELLPPEYPLELKDPSVMDDREFLKTHPRKNGVFEDKSVYKKVTMAQHHKPYNYYTGILRKYFPNQYRRVDPKSFGL